jgi:hypothetical protein
MAGWRRRLLGRGIVALMAFGAAESAAAIIGISIPEDSQSFQSRPAQDDVFAVSAVGGVLDIDTGIGIIVNPVFLSANDNTDFALHQHFPGHGTPPYSALFVPEPTTSTVVYEFDQQTIVSGLEIIQHANGITEVAGSIGDTLGSLASLGTTTGPSGLADDIGCAAVFTDGQSQVFDFGNTTLSGLMFSVTVTRSSCSFAYATHRIFLLDENGDRINAAGQTDPTEVPEPGSLALLGAGLLCLPWRRAKRCSA